MADILAIARSVGPNSIRLTCRWVLDPASGLVCVWEEDPLSRSCLSGPRLAA
jgi:hypothetical protein